MGKTLTIIVEGTVLAGVTYAVGSSTPGLNAGTVDGWAEMYVNKFTEGDPALIAISLLFGFGISYLYQDSNKSKNKE